MVKCSWISQHCAALTLRSALSSRISATCRQCISGSGIDGVCAILRTMATGMRVADGPNQVRCTSPGVAARKVQAVIPNARLVPHLLHAVTPYPGGEAIGVSPIYRNELTSRILEDHALAVSATLKPSVRDIERYYPRTAASKEQAACGNAYDRVHAAIDTSRSPGGNGLRPR